MNNQNINKTDTINEEKKIEDKELEEVINRISKVEIPTTKKNKIKILNSDSQHNMEIIIAGSVIAVVLVGFIGYSIISYKIFDNKLPQSASINPTNQSSPSDSSIPAEVLKLQEVTSDKDIDPVVPSPSGKNDPFQQLIDISNEISVSTNDSATTENDFIEWLLGGTDDVSSKKDQIKSLYQYKTNQKWSDLMKAFEDAKISFSTTTNPTGSGTADTTNTSTNINNTVTTNTSTDNTANNTTDTASQVNTAVTPITVEAVKVYSTDPKISDTFRKSSGGYSLSKFKVLATANNTVILSQIKINKIFYDTKCVLYGEFDIGGRIIYATSGDQLLEGYFVKGINYSKKSATIVDSKRNAHTIYLDETIGDNLK